MESIDFSFCWIDDSFASLFNSIIKAHNSYRNEAKWITGLRGEVDNITYKSGGLLEIYLNSNKISDNFIEKLCESLKNDQYLALLSLRNNSITNKGIENLITILKISNKTLINVELIGNPGYPNKELIEELAENFKKRPNKKKLLPLFIEKHWVDRELLNLILFSQSK